MSERESLPKAIGLCPGEHWLEFYVPDPDENEKCPECDKMLVIYLPRDEL